MNANGVNRQLARKIAWAVAMSTAASGVEAVWEGQTWLLDGFNRLSVAIGRAVHHHDYDFALVTHLSLMSPTYVVCSALLLLYHLSIKSSPSPLSTAKGEDAM